jgi:hypothetical protein
VCRRHRARPCGTARLDFTDLRCHSGLHNGADGAAIDNGGPREDHALLGLDVGVNRMHRVRCSTLSVDVTSLRMRMPAGDLIANAEQHEVAWDEVPHGETGNPLPVPQHGGVVGLDLAQHLLDARSHF